MPHTGPKLINQPPFPSHPDRNSKIHRLWQDRKKTNHNTVTNQMTGKGDGSGRRTLMWNPSSCMLSAGGTRQTSAVTPATISCFLPVARTASAKARSVQAFTMPRRLKLRAQPSRCILGGGLACLSPCCHNVSVRYGEGYCLICPVCVDREFYKMKMKVMRASETP